SGDQRAVLEALEGDLGERRAACRLLHGVTGSGKTEVYLRAALLALEQGRGVIVLVPEIALTPQIVGRFIDRFGETVAVLHAPLRRRAAGGQCDTARGELAAARPHAAAAPHRRAQPAARPRARHARSAERASPAHR